MQRAESEIDEFLLIGGKGSARLGSSGVSCIRGGGGEPLPQAGRAVVNAVWGLERFTGESAVTIKCRK